MEIALNTNQERTLNLLSKPKDLPSPQGGSFGFRAGKIRLVFLGL